MTQQSLGATNAPNSVKGPEVLLGVGGLPMSNPFFVGPGQQMIRHDTAVSTPGPNVPRHWYDGGNGWVTKYFYDSVPRDMKNARTRQVSMPSAPPKWKAVCDNEISESESCKGNCCWTPRMTAFPQMSEHVRTVHGATPPPRRQWSSNLFALDGLVEAFVFCSPCVFWISSIQGGCRVGRHISLRLVLLSFSTSRLWARLFTLPCLPDFIWLRSTTSMNTAALLCWCRDGVLRALWP